MSHARLQPSLFAGQDGGQQPVEFFGLVRRQVGAQIAKPEGSPEASEFSRIDGAARLAVAVVERGRPSLRLRSACCAASAVALGADEVEPRELPVARRAD